MKILHVVGTRPNFVKMAPVVEALATRLPDAVQVVVHTQQHYDAEMSQVFVDELGFPLPNYRLGAGTRGHAAQTARVMERLEPVLKRERPDVVVLAGDVNSTLAATLAAVKLEIPVAHVEAGLRSFDRTMPEEINRILTDQISTWCFTHSPEAEENLLREGVGCERIHFVGNTMIDTLVRLRPRIERSDVLDRLGLRHDQYVFVTLHRPRLVDGPLLEEALAALARLSSRLPVVFPMHPRTRARMEEPPRAPGLHLIDPLGYIDCLALQSSAAAVITDSGGIQEETTVLRVPCFTLRDSTERPVTITHGTNQLLGLNVERIQDVVALAAEVAAPAAPPPLWDGHAGERIADVLLASSAAITTQANVLARAL